MISEPITRTDPAISDCPSRPTILIIDDDESQVVALEHRLDKLGYYVLKALVVCPH
jgi:hypothetical protein